MATPIKVSLARFWVLVGAASLVVSLTVVPMGPARADSISQTRALIQALSAKLAQQEQLSESLAEKYNNSTANLAQIDVQLGVLRRQIIAKRAELGTTSSSLRTAAVHAYVLGAADAQFLAMFQQDLRDADARVQYENRVLGNLHDLTTQLKAQQQSLNLSLAAENSQRNRAAAESATIRNLLAENARNEAATRATLAQVSKRLRRQIIDYEIVVAKAASKRHDTKAIAAAVAAAAAVGGQAAANEVIAAIKKASNVSGTPAGTTQGLAALNAAKSVIGTPYVWGGESPRYGFDCSGLTQWSWRQAGYSIPRTAASQYRALRRVPLDKLQPGDLLFYYNLDNDNQVDHVVMYAGSGPWGTNTIIAAAHRGTNVSLAPLFTYGLIGAGRP